MKTLRNYTIIYDDECPMCHAYTKAFTRTGMLDKDGREAFSEMKSNPYNLNLKRASNEIALVNKSDNSTIYGIKSLFKIIGHSFPVFKPLFKYQPFQYLMARLYFFISYNRKVVAPGKVFESQNSCTPSLNIKYRMVYIIFAWLCTSYILYFYSGMLSEFVPASTMQRAFLICGGQLIFQAAIVACVRKDRIIHYLGNLMTVSLGGASLLLPMLTMRNFITESWPFLVYFMMVVGLMFIEHIRRVRILELPFFISLAWVLYRIIALGITIDFKF